MPGAGKGTQAAQFAQRWGIPKISTGDMMRDAVARGSELGARIAATIQSGGLVDDNLIVRVVEERLGQADTRSGFVLDGFPRTVPQAAALGELVSERDPLAVIYLEINPEVILQRILLRRICGGCGLADSGAHSSDYCAACGGTFVRRDDDQPHVVRERLAAYAEKTQPLVDWYRASATFRTINGDQPLAEVARAFDKAVFECVGGPGLDAG
jgi:adenylate kinase